MEKAQFINSFKQSSQLKLEATFTQKHTFKQVSLYMWVLGFSHYKCLHFTHSYAHF